MSAAGFAYLCAFLTSAAMGVFWVGLPSLVMEWFHAEAWHLGLIGGLVAGIRVVTGMIPGRLSGRVGRHHVMAAGAVMLAVCMAAVRFAPSLWVVVGLMVGIGTGLGVFWVALEAYLSDHVGPTALRRRMGWFNVSWSTGDTLGCFVGGALFQLALYLRDAWGSPGLRAAPCMLAGAVLVIIAVIVLTRLHSRPEREYQGHERDEDVPKSPARGGHSSLAVFWGMALVANCAGIALRGTLVSIFPKFGQGELHYSEVQWGVLLGLMCLARTLGFVYWQRRHDWEYRAGYFFWVQALLPLGALMLVFGTSYWVFAAAFLLVGIGTSKTYFASIFYSMDAEHGHERRSGIHEAAANGGTMLLFFGGVLGSATGQARAPYVFMLALVTVGIAIQLVMYRRSIRANR